MQIYAKRVGNAMKYLMYAVESNPKVLFSTLCPPNSLTGSKAMVSMEVMIDMADRTKRYDSD